MRRIPVFATSLALAPLVLSGCGAVEQSVNNAAASVSCEVVALAATQAQSLLTAASESGAGSDTLKQAQALAATAEGMAGAAGRFAPEHAAELQAAASAFSEALKAAPPEGGPAGEQALADAASTFAMAIGPAAAAMGC